MFEKVNYNDKVTLRYGGLESGLQVKSLSSVSETCALH